MAVGICTCLAFHFIVLLNIKIIFFGILTMSNSYNIPKENEDPENTFLRDNSRKKS